MKKRYTLLVLLVSTILSAQNVTHGPIIGGVTPTGCRVFIRTDVATTFTAQVSADLSFTNGVLSFNGSTDAAKDTVSIVSVSGLTADTKYYVRTIINAQPNGQVSSFETFPAPGTATHQVFTTGSCHYDITSADSSIYTRMAMDHPKAFVNCGDWGYPDADSGTIDIYLVNPPTSFAARIENHRTFYKRRYSCPGSYSFLHNFPVDYVYDDHDYLNDNSADDAVSGFGLNILNSFGAPKVYSQPAIARLNSIRAYQEWFPSYPVVDSSEGIYHSFRSGNVEFFVPDLRAMRTPQASAIQKVGNNWVYTPSPTYSIVGANQMNWLKNALANSTATWKIIISSDAFNLGLRMTYDTCLKIGNGPVTYWAPSVSGINIPNYGYTAVQNFADCWAGYKEDADSIALFAIQHNIKNVFVVSGDTHTVGLDDGTNSGLPELNCGILKKANSLDFVTNQAFMGFNVWNKGGSGLCEGTNFESAYGRIETFGDDSLHLSANDANGNEIVAWTFMANEPYKYNPLYHVNRIPHAANDAANVATNGSVTVTVATNDGDAENDPLFVNIKTNPAHGTSTVNNDNTVTYAPTAGYVGVDSFRYLICDHNNATCPDCASALVTLNVGTSDIDNLTADAIALYPNPATDMLTVESSSAGIKTIEVINTSGIEMLKANFTEKTLLDISSLASGTYICKITDTVGKVSVRRKLSVIR